MRGARCWVPTIKCAGHQLFVFHLFHFMDLKSYPGQSVTHLWMTCTHLHEKSFKFGPGLCPMTLNNRMEDNDKMAYSWLHSTSQDRDDCSSHVRKCHEEHACDVYWRLATALAFRLCQLYLVYIIMWMMTVWMFCDSCSWNLNWPLLMKKNDFVLFWDTYATLEHKTSHKGLFFNWYMNK